MKVDKARDKYMSVGQCQSHMTSKLGISENDVKLKISNPKLSLVFGYFAPRLSKKNGPHLQLHAMLLEVVQDPLQGPLSLRNPMVSQAHAEE